MPATFIGVRHHSPACARLVGETIAALRPAYVLVEGFGNVELVVAIQTGPRQQCRLAQAHHDAGRTAGTGRPGRAGKGKPVRRTGHPAGGHG